MAQCQVASSLLSVRQCVNALAAGVGPLATGLTGQSSFRPLYCEIRATTSPGGVLRVVGVRVELAVCRARVRLRNTRIDKQESRQVKQDKSLRYTVPLDFHFNESWRE